MDIDRIIRNMPSSSREVLKEAINNYNRTHDRRYAEEAIAILQNFDDDDAVMELIKTLKR